jgi:hypothetical protein
MELYTVTVAASVSAPVTVSVTVSDLNPTSGGTGLTALLRGAKEV